MFAEVARGVLGAAASAFGTRPFVVDRVHGAMSAGRRYDVLSPVDEPTLITNARVLTTGVDVPAVDMVVFADPKQSHIDILQAMARAARVVPGKECGYVFVPIGEDEDGPFTTAVEVMRAYVANDEELREELNAVAREATRRGRELTSEEWPAPLRNLIEDTGLLDKLVLQRAVATIARELTDTWETKFGLLLAFRDREGHCDVPRKHEEQGVNLGTWLGDQRTAQKKGLLGDGRRRRLEEAGVTWDVLDAQWEKYFALLVEYREREGNCDVPRNHEERGALLGSWLDNQRTARAKRALDADKERRLEEAGVRLRVRE